MRPASALTRSVWPSRISSHSPQACGLSANGCAPPEAGFKGSAKTDWNFRSPTKPFDSGDWDDLKPNQPFFAQLHFHHTHRPFAAPAEELYDLETDPHEIHNLAATPDHRATLEKLRAALDRWMEETGDQGRTPESPEIDAKWGGYMREFWDSVEASRQGKGKVSVPWLRNWPASSPQTPKPSK
jgi:hypothetical protein